MKVLSLLLRNWIGFTGMLIIGPRLNESPELIAQECTSIRRTENGQSASMKVLSLLLRNII